jgi:hypothetical protein
MLKKKSLINKFNKLLLSVNKIIESFFNNLTALFSFKKISLNNLIESFFNNLTALFSFKKRKTIIKNIDQKILIGLASVFILILSYFLIPTLLDKKIIITKFENQVLEKYNLEVKLNDSLKYGLFPKPHFLIKNMSLNYNQENLAQSDILKIYISINNFFSSDNLRIKNLVFKKTKFNIDLKDLTFFQKILNFNKSEHDIVFKNSNLFYKDRSGDVIFLININNLNFLYNDKFSQELKAKLEIFNIPLKLNIINDPKEKIFFAYLNSHKLRLSIDNIIDYKKKNKVGSLDFKIINLSKKINLTLNNESLSYKSEEDNFKGNIDLKPFYLSSDFKFNSLHFEKVFDENSILMDLLNSEILNNENLNGQLNFYFKDIKGINYIKNIFLKTYLEEGNLVIKDSKLNWKNSIIINLEDIQLINDNNRMIVAGAISFDFNKISNFYKQFQIKKIYRKEIKKVKLDFWMDIDEQKIEIDNLKIDGVSNKNTDEFLNNFNSKKVNIFNKIIFKNSIKEFFSNI